MRCVLVAWYHEVRIRSRTVLVDFRFHVSFQNTNTGCLTATMFDAVLRQAKTLAGIEHSDLTP